MTYLRALGLGLLFFSLTIWTALLHLIGRRLHRGWSVLQETTVRMMRFQTARGVILEPAVLRERVDALAGMARIRPGKIEIVSAAADGLRGDWLAPPDLEPDAPLIYYLHGGGYFFCSPLTHRLLMLRLARAAQARVLGLDYRLAPEHKFPAALDDAVAGYRRLLELGHEPARIIFAGDSAGGGLALAAMLRLRAEGAPLPAGAALLSPWVDLAAEDASLVENAATDYISAGGNVTEAAAIYLGETEPRDPLASPLHGELAALPPLLLHVGGVEVLRGQVERLAARAEEAGVDATLRVYPGMVHVWHSLPEVFPEAAEAVREIGRFVRAKV